MSSKKNTASQPPESALHKAIMTPIIFVSFLFSLAWVELRYSVLRSHRDCHHSRMPAWLHHLVYRRQAFQYVVVRRSDKDKDKDRDRERDRDRDGSQPYYHSMQRKLLKMETDEAFRIRATVLAVMAGTAAAALWGAVTSVRWLIQA